MGLCSKAPVFSAISTLPEIFLASVQIYVTELILNPPVDGRNPAPVDRLFIYFLHPNLGFEGFFPQHYHHFLGGRIGCCMYVT